MMAARPLGHMNMALGRNARPHMARLPAPYEPPVMMVNFGTLAELIAVMKRAPALAMPPCSASTPTMNPATSARKSKGMSRLQHRSMKWVALTALSVKSTPSFASTPTFHPPMRAKPVISVGPNSPLNSVSSPPSSKQRSTSRVGVGFFGLALTSS
ncbi:hypothetical protein D9M68_847530 [compost metagenome]